MSWFSETWFNLTNLTALKGMMLNMKADFTQWLLYELSPSFYITGLSWSGLLTEMIGWTKHIGYGVAFMVVWLIAAKFITKLKNWMAFLSMAGIAFVIEIIQFLMARASFINPINSILDIAFYVAGSALLLFVWNKIRGYFNKS